MSLKVSPEIIFNEKDSEDKTILIDLSDEKDVYFQLTGVSRDFWRMINAGLSASEIIKNICREYDVKEVDASADLESFISDLKQRKVLL